MEKTTNHYINFGDSIKYKFIIIQRLNYIIEYFIQNFRK